MSFNENSTKWLCYFSRDVDKKIVRLLQDRTQGNTMAKVWHQVKESHCQTYLNKQDMYISLIYPLAKKGSIVSGLGLHPSEKSLAQSYWGRLSLCMRISILKSIEPKYSPPSAGSSSLIQRKRQVPYTFSHCAHNKLNLSIWVCEKCLLVIQVVQLHTVYHMSGCGTLYAEWLLVLWRPFRWWRMPLKNWRGMLDLIKMAHPYSSQNKPLMRCGKASRNISSASKTNLEWTCVWWKNMWR